MSGNVVSEGMAGVMTVGNRVVLSFEARVLKGCGTLHAQNQRQLRSVVMSLPWGGIGVRGSSAPHIPEAYSLTFASGASNNPRDRRCASRVTLAVPTIHTLFSIQSIDGVFNFPARHRKIPDRQQNLKIKHCLSSVIR
jgi:hypothetical protein